MRIIFIAILFLTLPTQLMAVNTYCWGGKWKGECCTNHIFGTYTPGPIHVFCDGSISRKETFRRYRQEISRLQKRTWKFVRQGIIDSISQDDIRKWKRISKEFVDAEVSPAITLFLRLLKEDNNNFKVTATKGAFHKRVFCEDKIPNGHCAGLAVDIVPLDKRWYKTRESIKLMMPKGVRYKALLLEKDSCPNCTGKHIHFEFLSQQDAQTFITWKTCRLYQEF